MPALKDSSASARLNNSSGVSKPLLIIFIITLVVTLGILAVFGYSLLVDQNTQEMSDEQVPTINFSAQSYEEFFKESSKVKWDPSTMAVSTEVMQIDEKNDRLLLFFTWPPQIAGNSKWVKILCTEFSIVEIRNNGLSRTSIEKEVFYDFLLEGKEHGIDGFCQNEQCDAIDRGCSYKIPKNL